MRRALLIAALLAGCGSNASSTEPDGTTPAEGCPYAVDDPCMNEDNHAACLEVASKCPGEVVQLESCPLQFSCMEE